MQVPASNHSQNAHIASLILALTHDKTATRQNAAREIFRRGSDRTLSLHSQWFHDADLGPLFVRGASSESVITVGVAVTPDLFEKIRRANGMAPLADVPPDQDAVEFDLEFPTNVRLDVLTTRDIHGGGAIANYLQKFGMGIQQVEFVVKDVDKATTLLRKNFGVEPIYPRTRAGANNTRVNFFLVTTPDNKKVLIEFVEAAR